MNAPTLKGRFPSRVLLLVFTIALLAFGCGRDGSNPVAVSPEVTGAQGAAGFSTLDMHIPGAIFTTLMDGSRVNHNIYEAKEDVCLDGGPPPNAPPLSAGLPEGDYYFQVTDPSGKDLLSTDHISCRRVHVGPTCVFDLVYVGTDWVRQQGQWVQVTGQHAWGVDQDHSELGAIAVQLLPFDDTKNKGGVYKVWVTRCEDYAGDPNFVPSAPNDQVNGENWQPANVHGFIPSMSKTDCFKVEQRKPFTPAVITIRKFHDPDVNGVQGVGEPDVPSWPILVTDPSGVTNSYFTPVELMAAEPGDYTVVEGLLIDTFQTVGVRDGVPMSAYPTADSMVPVTVAGSDGETHEVVFGNAAYSSVTALKCFDQDGDGVAETGEALIPGWKMELTGTDILGRAVGPVVAMTDGTGCAAFSGLFPGDYTIAELMPTTGGWICTGSMEVQCVVASLFDGGTGTIVGASESMTFTNVCVDTAGFGTKGYWHNKNGLSEMTDADIAYVNGLDPYDDPTSYFDAGDEAFDGFFSDGTPVPAAHGSWGEIIAPAGTPRAEISWFLVDSNAGADPREQLAQQLLAFIFNVCNRVGGVGGAMVVDGSVVAASDLIADAVACWQTGTAADRNAMADLLDGMNNSSAVPYVPGTACVPVYP